MKHATRIALIGLMAGTAVAMAAGVATAHGRMGPQMGFGPGDDGLLGLGERGMPFAVAFVDLDTDDDGQITEEDLAARAAARFAEADADGSGTLSADELTARVVAQINARMQGQVPNPRMGDPAGMAKTLAERIVAARDSNKDGALAADELGPQVSYGRMIDRFDTDDDNAISQAEFDTAKAEMQTRMGKSMDGQRSWGPKAFGSHGGRW